MKHDPLNMEQIEAELQRMKIERDKALSELHDIKKVASKAPKNRSKSEHDVNLDIKPPLEETSKEPKNKEKMANPTTTSEKDLLIDTMIKELERRKESNDVQTQQLERANNMIENLRIQILSLKNKVKLGSSDENSRLRNEVERLEYELRLQRDRTATDEVVMLRNELRFAMEGEENSKQAMDELASVLREVAAEGSEAKEKLNEAKKENKMMKNMIDQLRKEAEESQFVCNMKETEFVKCIKKEEDDKACLQEELRVLLEALAELEETSMKLRVDSEKLKVSLKASFDEAEMAKIESLELMDCLVENQRRLSVFRQENERLRVYEIAGNDNVKEKKNDIPLSPKKESKSDDLTSTSSKKESKSHGLLNLSFSKKEKVEEKDQKKTSMTPSSSKKSSHSVEEKEQKKMKNCTSLEKDSSKGHSKSCFDPKSMLPIAGMPHRNREVGDSHDEDDNDLTDSIFDLVVDKPHKHRTHRRTTSSLDDEKSRHSEEFEHSERPHLDDMEVERAGSHSTKKGVLLRKFGDLWKKKNPSHGHHHSHSHSHSHSRSHSYSNSNSQNLHQKELAT